MADNAEKQNFDRVLKPLADDIRGLTERQTELANKMATVHAENTDMKILVTEIKEEAERLSTAISELLDQQTKALEKISASVEDKIQEAVGKKLDKNDLKESDFIHKMEAVENETPAEFRNNQQNIQTATRIAVLQDFKDLIFPSKKRGK